MCNLIRTLNDALGATSVVVTYDVHEALKLADYLYILGRRRDRGPRAHAGDGRVDDPSCTSSCMPSPTGPVRFHYPARADRRRSWSSLPPAARPGIDSALHGAETPAPPLPEAFASAEAFMEAFAHDCRRAAVVRRREGRVRFASDALARVDRTSTRAEIVGKTLREIYGADAYEQFEPWTDRALAGEDVHYERQATRTRRHAALALGEPAPAPRRAAARCVGYFSCALEVNELKRTHDALGRALQELATHIENTPLAVVEWSADIRVKRWSPRPRRSSAGASTRCWASSRASSAWCTTIRSRWCARLTRELTDGRARRNRMLAAQRHQGRAHASGASGTTRRCSTSTARIASILSLAEDVTARVDAEEQLRQAAVHDALTGLPNRNSLAARLEHAILRVNRSGDRLALLFIDLDRFKKVNDTLGHAAGDEVLRQTAARIRACVREVDTVARLGGDEFVVLLETDVRPDTPGIIGERIRNAFDSPFDWKGLRCAAARASASASIPTTRAIPPP